MIGSGISYSNELQFQFVVCSYICQKRFVSDSATRGDMPLRTSRKNNIAILASKVVATG